VFDPSRAQDALIEIPIQVNGKLRSRLMVSPDVDEETLKQQALADEKLKAAVGDKQVRKVIVAKGRLINIVVG